MDGGNEIILANRPNNKQIICISNNDIPVKIPSHPYYLVNRSVLCNCSIEADNHYLLESIAACDNSKRNSKLAMYFMINTAFSNYLDMFPNSTESLQVLLIETELHTNKSYLLTCIFQAWTETLLHMSTNLKDFINRYTMRKEIFDLQERHESTILNTNKNFFSNNHIMDIFMFISSIISLTTTTLTIYLFVSIRKLEC